LKGIFKHIGPATLVTAAFIGPGTITVCSVSGIQYGYQLMWAMILSIAATIIIQELAIRIAMSTGKGIPQVVIEASGGNKFLKWFMIGLIFSAIIIGNAAYEAGNLSGAIGGLESLGVEWESKFLLALIPGGRAFVFLMIGSYKVIERLLIVCVLLMSVAFIVSAILSGPDIGRLVKGLFIPSFPDGSIFKILGLIGTTVVPYNIFLHANLVNEKWENVDGLASAKIDLYVSVILGGIISMCIIICGAAVSQKAGGVLDFAMLAKGLEPLLGEGAIKFLGMGLLAAGLSSAITAPLAAAYVARDCFSWDQSKKDIKFIAIWLGILIIGIVVSSTSYRPTEIIQFAQVANGILLPVIVFILIFLANKKAFMKGYENTLRQNIAAGFIGIVSIVLGVIGINKVFDFIVF
jgi:NRAMP (natural resistance-associated macrophage protein)-like metal ion transporter